MAISYQNCPVTINGVNLFATNVSWNQSQSLQGLRVLGGAVTSAVTQAPEGEFTADFYIGSTGIAVKFGSALAKTGSEFFDCTIGDLTFSKCLLNSFNISAQTNALINGSLGVGCYGNIVGNISGTKATGKITGAHAAQSVLQAQATEEGIGIGFSSNPYSFTYDLSKEYSINRVVGTGDLAQGNVKFVSATERATLEGDRLPSGIAKDPAGSSAFACLTGYEVALELKSSCGASFGSVGLSKGNAVSRNLQVANNDTVRGSVTIERNY